MPNALKQQWKCALVVFARVCSPVMTLSRLKSLGMLTALIADCSLKVSMLWSQTPFAPIVDLALFSSREGLRKPDSMLYQRACDRLSVAPAECLYVGDGNSRGNDGDVVCAGFYQRQFYFA